MRWDTPFAGLLATLAIGAVLVVSLGGALFHDYAHTPTEPVGRSVEVVVPDRATLGGVAGDLARLGVVTRPDLFGWLARWMKLDGRIRAGRFLVRSDWTPLEVLRHLAFGRQHMERVTIPEGLPMWEVGRRLAEAGFVTIGDFEAVCADRAFLRAHGIPFASAEGFLWPETYVMMRPLELNRATARVVVGVLIDAFWRATSDVWGASPDEGQVRRVLTLASIVERETRVPGERARVAGVYANRLKRRMRLQADPTVAYGLGSGFVGPLRYRHLEDAANPYNTYRKAGLPPGPICSPGRACIDAARRPEEHGYLFFVAVGDAGGTHVFTRTLPEHEKAVQAYHRRMRTR